VFFLWRDQFGVSNKLIMREEVPCSENIAKRYVQSPVIQRSHAPPTKVKSVWSKDRDDSENR